MSGQNVVVNTTADDFLEQDELQALSQGAYDEQCSNGHINRAPQPLEMDLLSKSLVLINSDITCVGIPEVLPRHLAWWRSFWVMRRTYTRDLPWRVTLGKMTIILSKKHPSNTSASLAIPTPRAFAKIIFIPCHPPVFCIGRKRIVITLNGFRKTKHLDVFGTMWYFMVTIWSKT